MNWSGKDIAIEINSWPERLDLPDSLVKDGLGDGVSVARRGWCNKDDIINTRSYIDFRNWLHGKTKEGESYMNLLYILIGLGVLFALYLIATYNGFVVLKTRIKEALSGIDVQLKRRADLIPNLVETVKGYAKHEKGVFEEVTKARSSLMKAQTPADKAAANNMLTDALKSLFAVAEAYPDLKASENFRDLQRQLEDTEDKIAYSRQFYNSNVLDYNTKVQTFPSNMIANMFGFKLEEFFAATEEERKKVDVKF